MMRKFDKKCFLLVLLLYSTLSTIAQDLPLFSQKLTNSFLYNPSVAGNGLGSLTLSNRTFWSNVPGAPKSIFLSAHTPFGYQKYGVGFNIVNERIGILDNLYATGAFAYHININDESTLSFGLSSEYTNIRINSLRLDPKDEGDLILLNPEGRSSVDFSFGTSFRTELFEVGLSSNRLATAFRIADFPTHLSQFYTGYVIIKGSMLEDHLLEPMFVYRKLSTESSQWEAGLYYTYKEMFIAGASFRSGGMLHSSLGLKINNKYFIGYSYEMFGGGFGSNIGGSNEITLRLDFKQDSYYRNTKNAGSIMKESIAFRRKSMSSGGLKSKPMAVSSPKFKKKLKRNYIKSPSYRLNNSKKLTQVKRKPGLKKTGKKNLNNKKRRKSNYSKYKKKKGSSYKKRRK